MYKWTVRGWFVGKNEQRESMHSLLVVSGTIDAAINGALDYWNTELESDHLDRTDIFYAAMEVKIDVVMNE